MDKIFIMLKSRTFLISSIVLIVAIQCGSGEERRKRQAPSINVHQIPKTSFSCVDRTIGEYYADPEVYCQVYHVCVPGMNNKASLISFVCPNGTIFSQATRVCTPYERVDCNLATNYYDSVNGQHDSSNTRSSETSARSVESRPVDLPEPPRPSPPRSQSGFRSNPNQLTGRATTKAPAPARPVTTRAPLTRSPPAAFTPRSIRPPVTPRSVVSTSTSSYNYEYEYDYEYEEDTPARSKRATSGFTCEGKVHGAAYADTESNCEMFHICVRLGNDKVLDYKVFCENSTAFDQEIGYCREKGEFVCENAPLFYQFQKPTKSSKKPVTMNKKKYIPSKASE